MIWKWIENFKVSLEDVVRLSAQITDTNVANEFGSQYALYQITITRMNGAGIQSKSYQSNFI